MSKADSLYKRLRKRSHLKKAWQVIRANAASKKSSRSTRALAQKFSESEDRGLERISEQLLAKTFVFPPARGVAIKKEGKSTKRPLVVFGVESRIVQRALLDIVKSIPAVKATLRSGFNFGGVDGDDAGVEAAVMKAKAAAATHAYFIRSDVKAFFDSVTRNAAVQCLTKHVSDPDLVHLLEAATNVELANRAALGDDIKYFPSDDHGLAQGSCLSPLLCNLVLEEFDRRMNSSGTVCIRYVDDFIIFAADRRRARSALSVGLSLLQKLNLSAYDPATNREKAEEGLTTASIEFLGCEIAPGGIKPSIKNRRKLLGKVDKILQDRTLTVTQLLSDLNRTVLGWGNTFGFCTDEAEFSNLDRELHKRILDALHDRIWRARNSNAIDWLSAIGIQPLAKRKR